MVPGAGAWGRALPLPEAAAPEHVAGKGSFLLSCAGQRRGNFLLQFLAVVPNQENFCFPEWPMERNAGHKVFTRFHKMVQTEDRENGAGEVSSKRAYRGKERQVSSSVKI